MDLMIANMPRVNLNHSKNSQKGSKLQISQESRWSSKIGCLATRMESPWTTHLTLPKSRSGIEREIQKFRQTKDLGSCFHAFFLHQADKDFRWNFQYDYNYDYEWNYVYNDGIWTYGNGDCVLVSVCLYLFIIMIAYFKILKLKFRQDFEAEVCSVFCC